MSEAKDGTPNPGEYRLRLYIAGNSPRSRRAVRTLTHLAEKYLGDRADLEVIDIYQQTERAKEDQVVGVPTLIRALPEPLRRLLGDLSDERRVLVALDLDVDGDDSRD